MKTVDLRVLVHDDEDVNDLLEEVYVLASGVVELRSGIPELTTLRRDDDGSGWVGTKYNGHGYTRPTEPYGFSGVGLHRAAETYGFVYWSP